MTGNLMASMYRGATISADGVYRYTLIRSWGPRESLTRPAVWVMLNPSTADAHTDDPTIRRVVGFTRAWGYSSALVVNLYALRATHPTDLTTHPDPVGPHNEVALSEAFTRASLIVAAWGAHPMAAERAATVRGIADARRAAMVCLGTTRAGHPRHPLYVPAATRPVTLTAGAAR